MAELKYVAVLCSAVYRNAEIVETSYKYHIAELMHLMLPPIVCCASHLESFSLYTLSIFCVENQVQSTVFR